MNESCLDTTQVPYMAELTIEDSSPIIDFEENEVAPPSHQQDIDGSHLDDEIT